jgi:transcriptional regulator with XRE-family HTH domain
MKLSNRRPFYLKQWRQHRQLTQQKLADRLDVTKGYISELERGVKRYNQDVLEALAEALMCQPADLLIRDPSNDDAIWSIWDSLPPEKRKQAIAVIRALTDAA